MENEEETAISPVKKRVKIAGATYMEEEKSVFIVGECDEGDFKHMIDRNALGSFGDRTEEEIIEEMHKTASLMEGKELWLVFDPEAEKKIENGEELDYSNIPECIVEREAKIEGGAEGE